MRSNEHKREHGKLQLDESSFVLSFKRRVGGVKLCQESLRGCGISILQNTQNLIGTSPEILLSLDLLISGGPFQLEQLHAFHCHKLRTFPVKTAISLIDPNQGTEI